MNNNSFQLDRFLVLLKIEFARFLRSKYLALTITGGFSLLFIIIYSFTGNISLTASSRADFYVGVIKFIFLLSPLFFYRNINHPQKGLIDVMLPASVFEKFLRMQLFCFIILPFSILLFSASFDMLFSLLLSPEPFYLVLTHIIDALKSSSGSKIWTLLFYSQLFFLLNLIIKTHKMLKTLGVLLLAHISLVIIVIILSQILFTNNEVLIDTLTNITFNIDFSHPFWRVCLNILGVMFSYGLIAAAMVSSYYKMKSLRF